MNKLNNFLKCIEVEEDQGKAHKKDVPSGSAPKLYGLSKSTKKDSPFRPIMSRRVQSLTERTKNLSESKDHSQSNPGQHIMNTKDIVEEVKNISNLKKWKHDLW